MHSEASFVAVGKPAGMPVVPDSSGDRSLFDDVRDWALQRRRGEAENFVGVVHRLDRPVSGLVLFALTRAAAASLSAAFKKRRMEKLYWGMAQGQPRAQSGSCTLYLRKHPTRNTVRGTVAQAPGTDRADTDWEVLERLPGRTLLALRPQTGRSHQLRVTAQHLGVSLIGDVKYGAERALSDASIALHALGLRGPHPDGGRLDLELPPPDSRVWSRAHERLATGGARGWKGDNASSPGA
ncbi:MAG: RNA pseudouridine synthase [Planctomycetota bacterium]|nr:MAG: RNA pseudouridine synthase [Planctomycetota bacterium]